MKMRRAAIPALEWNADLAGGCARVIAVGSRCLRVENHAGVLDLTEERVALSTRQGQLTVEGAGLTLCDIRPGVLVIRGHIARIHLPCGPEDR